MPQAQPVDPFAVTGRKRVTVSPLHARSWRLILMAAAGSAAAWLIQNLFGTGRFLPVAAATTALVIAWAAAVRLLFLDMKGRGFWGLWLAVGAVFALASPAGSRLWIAGTCFSGIFLIFRRFRPFSHLSHRSRTRVFFVSLAAWSALTWAWFVGGKAVFVAPTQAVGYLINPLRYAWIGLQIFWTLTLLHLFFKARLHAVRIRPKLAVSTLLIAVVPFIWLVVMGAVTGLSVVGEIQAARAGMMLRDWAEMSFDIPGLGRALSERWFEAGPADPAAREGTPPSWWADYVAAAKTPGNAEAIVSGAKAKGFFLRVGNEVWGIRRDAGGRPAGGFCIDTRFLTRLARIVHADVEFALSEPPQPSSARPEDSVTLDLNRPKIPPLVGLYDPSRPERKGWRIGMSSLALLELRAGLIVSSSAYLSVFSTPGLILSELYSKSNPVSRILFGALLVLGILLLVLESFVLGFGIRISAGITSAVRALHRGARRIAAGDLDTPIAIPNEDELGDLAAAVNEMAAGVKRGRAEASKREALERELAVAREIQERLLPHVMPAVPGFEISGASLPSQQVGGDYFDFLDLEDGRLGIAIADVSGKGIPAALLMANLQAILRGQAEERGDVSAVLARVNSFLVRSTDPHMFVTFFYGILDRVKGVFLSSNAGHNPPLLLRVDGTIEWLSAGGLLLGFLAGQDYAQQATELRPGDVVVLFTDGITEASDPGAPDRPDRFFGEERLIEVVRRSAGLTAGEIQAAILDAVAAHTAGAPQSDDITLVVFKRRREGEE